MRQRRVLSQWSGRPAFVVWGLYIGLVFVRPYSAVHAVETPQARIRIEQGHAWRPPFGLDRIGQPLVAAVELDSIPTSQKLTLVAYRRGQEIARQTLTLTGQAPAAGRASFETRPTELVLVASSVAGDTVELARLPIDPIPFEAEAVARPEEVVNPVDLGAILVPNDWLLLAAGQSGVIDVAAMSREADISTARVTAWFETTPTVQTTADLPLKRDVATRSRLPVPALPANGDQDVLHVQIATGDGPALWHKMISTMFVRRRPEWPKFGAVETKLRYDAPISVKADDGTFSSMNYADAWDASLNDVVVALPNGSRFVFWRGSSYIPFWAGRYNTGLSYEWAETSPPPDGFTDCVEPLMDKELRYGRVRIVESTPSRIHVRWSYQSCDFQYKVWGDSAVEDYYFYPDGFGTRVLTLQSIPTGDYELSEFIIMSPQATYPFSIVPPNLVDILFVDGQKRELTFPFLPAEQGDKIVSRDLPAIFRVRLHKDDPQTAVYFNPLDIKLPQAVFGPFHDQGQVVTPCYWGSHWPLARGKTTGSTIDDRVQFSPCHNSVMSWARSRPVPLRTAQVETLDTLGHAKPMLVQTWAWLIGTTDAGDERLLEWAASFAKPPTLEVQGARLEAESYVPERRAMRLVVEAPIVTLTVKPTSACVHPVFELEHAPQALSAVEMGGRRLDSSEYAWDGRLLWLNSTLRDETRITLTFSE